VPDTSPITLQEAADRLGVHYMTAYRYVRTGRLPAERSGSQWLVDPRDLAAVGRTAAPAGRPTKGGANRSRRATLSRRLEARLVAGDEAGAWAVVEAALGSGATPDEVLVDGIGPAMDSIGRHWKDGTYSVDDEHRATAVTLRLVSRLGARFSRRGPKRPTVILGTPPGELHGLPTAMAANVLRGRGYEVVDLGANVPPEAFATAVAKASRPLAVAVAVTAGDHDRSIRAIVRSLHESAPGVAVLVGGAAIETAAHAARLGARWTGADARSLGELVEELGGRAGR